MEGATCFYGPTGFSWPSATPCAWNTALNHKSLFMPTVDKWHIIANYHYWFSEFIQLQKLLKPAYTALKYIPDAKVVKKYKDGGVAIIEQIICSYAKFFVGTHESTFSFRIQEEREILGFQAKTTFNRLCGDENDDCQQPTAWKIVYWYSNISISYCTYILLYTILNKY